MISSCETGWFFWSVSCLFIFCETLGVSECLTSWFPLDLASSSLMLNTDLRSPIFFFPLTTSDGERINWVWSFHGDHFLDAWPQPRRPPCVLPVWRSKSCVLLLDTDMQIYLAPDSWHNLTATHKGTREKKKQNHNKYKTRKFLISFRVNVVVIFMDGDLLSLK